MASSTALCLALFLFVVAGTHGFTKTALTYYQVAHRYTCGKKYFLLYERPLLFTYGEMYAQGVQPTFVCEIHTAAKNRGSGIMATVQRLKIRAADPTKCLDSLKYNVDQTLRCGNMRFGMPIQSDGGVHPPPPFISLYSGPFSYGTPVSSEFVPRGNVVFPGKALVSYVNINKVPLNYLEELKIYIAYTAYIDCDANNVTKGWFNCGYGVCISERLVYDGVVNCPFGDCIDEGGCEETTKGYPQLTGMFTKKRPVGKSVKEAGPPYPVPRIPPAKKELHKEEGCSEPIIGPRDRNRPGSRTRQRPRHPRIDDADSDEFFLKVYLNVLEKMKDRDVATNQKKIVERVSQYLLRTHKDMWNGTART